MCRRAQNDNAEFPDEHYLKTRGHAAVLINSLIFVLIVAILSAYQLDAVVTEKNLGQTPWKTKRNPP